METCNVKAILDALNEIKDMIDEWRTNGEMDHWQYSKLFDITDAALATPPRNCDLFETPKEAGEAFISQECENPCGNCTVSDECNNPLVHECGIEWLFSEAKGDKK